MNVSEELDDIMSLSDRIGVIFEGAVVGIVEGRGADREVIGHWIARTTSEAA